MPIVSKSPDARKMLTIRVSPEQHAQLEQDAHASHQSVNSLCCTRLAANRSPLDLAGPRLVDGALAMLEALAHHQAPLSTPLAAAVLKLEGALRIAAVPIPTRFREATPPANPPEQIRTTLSHCD